MILTTCQVIVLTCIGNTGNRKGLPSGEKPGMSLGGWVTIDSDYGFALAGQLASQTDGETPYRPTV